MKVLQNDGILILLWSNISVFPHQNRLFHMKNQKKPKNATIDFFWRTVPNLQRLLPQAENDDNSEANQVCMMHLWQSGLNRKLESELRDDIPDCSAKLCAALFRWRIGLGAAVSLESAHFWLDDQVNLTASQTYHCNIVTNVTPSPLKAKTMLTRYKLWI